MSDSYFNEGAISVGGFFEKYNVCIPILQRDYAQGREGKEYIREVFLKDIKDAITNKQPLTMDFIYGYQERKKEQDEEYNVFYPLDGQQRLTTVWLIYWYLALRSEKLENEKMFLRKFTYQTRKSSREFCEALCNNNFVFKEKRGLVNYIKNQRWFFASWKKDPTINAMLRMLGGTSEIDGIEPVFGDLATWQSKWEEKLNLYKKKITFCVLDIGNEKLPRENADQLYVKMNARGKALTDFENFKADLVGRIEKNRIVNLPDNSSTAAIKEIPKKLDNLWNDIFWKSANAGVSDGQTDEIFFAFINRFCFNQLCLQVDDEANNEYLLNQNLIRNINEILDESISDSKKIADISEKQKEILSLYSYYAGDNKIRYTKFDYYQRILDFDGLQALNTIFDRIKDRIDTINNLLSKINEVVSRREESKYRFLPLYQTDGNGKKQYVKDDNCNEVGIAEEITQKERVYFFAICKYFEIVEHFEEDKFKDWMRFCRNVIENSGVDSAAAMVTVMRRIDEFDPKDIITALSEMQISLDESTKIDKQIQEEIKKAKKIQSESSEWKERIICAEDTLFLCGKIGFLFTDENGLEERTCFDVKLKNLKEYFKTGSASIDFVRSYAKSFENFDDVRDKLIFHNKGWQRRGDSWLDILSEDDPRRVDRVLRDEEIPNNAKDDYLLFIDSKSFEYAVEKEGVFDGKKDLRIARYKNSNNSNRYALYKKSAQNDKLCFDSSSSEYPYFRRNSLLSDLLKIDGFSLDDNHVIVENEAYYFGDDIFFTYREKHFYWSSDDKIYGYDYSKGIKSKEPKLQEVSKKTSCDILPHLS